MEDLDPKSVFLIHLSEESKITHKAIYRFCSFTFHLLCKNDRGNAWLFTQLEFYLLSSTFINSKRAFCLYALTQKIYKLDSINTI